MGWTDPWLFGWALAVETSSNFCACMIVVGLGLAIVRDVVAAHAGTVTVEDAKPGARFIVLLPR